MLKFRRTMERLALGVHVANYLISLTSAPSISRYTSVAPPAVATTTFLAWDVWISWLTSTCDELHAHTVIWEPGGAHSWTSFWELQEINLTDLFVIYESVRSWKTNFHESNLNEMIVYDVSAVQRLHIFIEALNFALLQFFIIYRWYFRFSWWLW